MKLSLISIMATLAILFTFVSPVSAQTGFNKAKFDVTHTILPEGGIETRLDIGITDTKKGLEVSRFEITLPSHINYTDLSAISTYSPVTIEEENQKEGTKVIFNFSTPIASGKLDKLLEVTYNQKNSVVQQGTAYELILPSYGTTDQPSNVTLNTSGFIDKKLTIAKPRPDKNEKVSYSWLNVSEPAIFLAFGEYQTYKVNLKYHLTNDRFVAVRQDIAFPPETALQEVFVEKINPAPDEFLTDNDGNYIGRYVLDAQEKINISFDGFVKVYALEQENMIPYIRNQIKTQKSYLLKEQKYWEVTNPELIKSTESLKSALQIYDFTRDSLSYSFERLNETKERYGADGAFRLPDKAVCMEYTDMFVGISRLNGIAAREIQGYGYSDDERLRPISTASDILHAWPEYYDTASELWVPLDPTWEDTSGIDYKGGFDMNHIVLTIHGADSVYPLPAGMYKSGKTKDVDIHVTSLTPNKKEEIIVMGEFDEYVYKGSRGAGVLKVKNTGNVFIKNVPILLQSDTLSVSSNIKTIYLLSPGQTVEIPVTYSVKNKTAKNAEISINIGSLYQNSYFIKISTKTTQTVISTAKIVGIIAVLLIVISLVVKRI